MIVDLLRNDLGRVARFGSVTVESLFGVEAYETVWQMTSTIAAEARPGVGVPEVVEALFPCGSVTGAPKSSAMAAIADLEDSPRGAYCGAIGFMEPGGRRAVFSVAIRTAVVDLATGAVVYGTGGGITWDSVPDAEWDETAAKAAVLTTGRPPFDLLETLRIDRRGIHELERHLDRLAGSAAYFRRTLDLDAVRDALAEVPAGDPPRRIRLTVGPAGRASIEVDPIPADRGPVRLAVDPEPIDRHDVFRYHKTTSRQAYERAAARFPEADDVVAVNDAGEAVETTIGNLVVRIGGRWVTPPLASGCLPGVERARMLESGEVSEAVVRAGDLHRADEIQVVNSVRLRRPAVLV
jgi:para-aminobenzoate synthetase/4-amino-4-deoxychorismate lyase